MTDVPEEVRSAAADPASRLGRYVRVSRLGAGGMGEVWRAWDEGLSRWVALKLLKGSDAEEIARFKREAQTAARIAHPNIAAVYEVGESGGQYFIAMQLVEGRTLRHLAGAEPRRVVLAMTTAARALAYAHERGIVHRDVKPENLMIDAQSRVFVMDFGLAKQASVTSSLSGSGLLIGTPAYMSPEQARGDVRSVDARSDVWSMGATLYELLCGERPFDDEELLDLLMLIVEGEPPRLRARRPQIEPDLETIVMKCMEKEPARRYASAAALADDLQRWLDGEAISARRSSLVYRLRKRVAKHKWLSLATALLVVVAAAAGAMAWWATRARAEALRQLARVADTSVRAALAVRRAGDVAAMAEFARETEEACLEAVASFPDAPEPYYHLGRMRRAQMRFDEALAEQDRALAKDPSYAPARYERGMLRVRAAYVRWDVLVDQAWRRVGEQVVAGQPAAVQHVEVLSDGELSRLRAAAREDFIGLDRTMARAWLELIESKDHRESERRLAAAARSGQNEEEVWELLARGARMRGEVEAALQWYDEGVSRDRGYVPHRLGRAMCRLQQGYRQSEIGEDPAPVYRLAVADYDEVLRLAPSPEVLRLRGEAHMRWAVHLAQVGDDARPAFDLSRRDVDESLRQDPTSGTALRACAYLRANVGTSLRLSGDSVGNWLDEALRLFDAALQQGSDDYDSWNGRAGVRIELSQMMRERAEDPSRELEGAIQDATEGIRRQPNVPIAWRTRGQARVELAEYRGMRGEDAQPLFEEALRDLDHAVACGGHPSLLARGAALQRWAQYVDRRGEDASRFFARAEADFDAVLRMIPRQPTALQGRGMARSGRALRAGKDVDEVSRLALADLDEAARRLPRRLEPLFNRGQLRFNMGNTVAERGGDPSSEYRSSIADCDAALRIRPSFAELREQRARAWINWGRWVSAQGGDPSPHFRAAIDDCGIAIERDPKYVDAWVARAAARIAQGERAARAGTDPTDDFGSALKDLDRALEIASTHGEALRFRGNARYNMGLYFEKKGRPATEQFRLARADWEDAVRRVPSLAAMLEPWIEKCRRRGG